MAKKKKKVDGKEVAGRIITLFFVLLLIGGAYYLYTLFRDVEITPQNLTGTWKLAGDVDEYYIFSYDDEEDKENGRAIGYTQQKNSYARENEIKYTYELVLNNNNIIEMHLHALNDRGRIDKDIPEKVIKITKLSKAQMYVTINRSVMTALTREDLF